MQDLTPEHGDMKALILENQRLLGENNKLLKKLYRNAVITFWIRLLWIGIVIGLPFLIYFYLVEPYFEAFGSSFSTFQSGLQEIPGWKQFYESVQDRAPSNGE
jgi:Trk-type K+ transport system membrane component